MLDVLIRAGLETDLITELETAAPATLGTGREGVCNKETSRGFGSEAETSGVPRGAAFGDAVEADLRRVAFAEGSPSLDICVILAVYMSLLAESPARDSQDERFFRGLTALDGAEMVRTSSAAASKALLERSRMGTTPSPAQTSRSYRQLAVLRAPLLTLQR
ncbi:hypothetical protein DAEQUDRAFT_781448 [Daedalea quercina L-15889]|uniref:Uncharacterized protein n=1 Tax=Daedalea quercina L-15889 TaxID=1314783 RepID=A0A165RF82_9APHY|nr:hypothetical protein DAEQUDRAFT_781448 [Daedalea quercina L-15889]